MSFKVTGFFDSSITSIPSALNPSYIPVLDGFRGIAILLVILSHILLKTSFDIYNIGRTGVEVFFVLSGFLITSLLLKEKIKIGKVSLKKFYIRRALRILPVAYLFLATLIVFNLLFKLNLSYGSFIVSALYLNNFPLHYEANWFNGHFWTLAIEEQFYLIFPVIIIYSLKNYIKLIFAVILLLPLLQYLGFHNVGVFYSNYLIHKLTYLLIYLFQNGSTSILIGSLLSILMFKNMLPSAIKKGNKYLSFGLLLLAVWLRLVYWEIAYSMYFSSVMFSSLFAVVIYLTVLNPNDFLSGILRNKILINLGILSYSLYIWQQIFLYKQPWEHSFKYADSLYFNLPALFIVAYLSYNFFELKFLKFKDRFKSV